MEPQTPPISGEALRLEVAALAEQVRALGRNGSTAQEGDRLLEGVIAMAELAAAEIRAGAERAAAEIRIRAGDAIADADAAIDLHTRALAKLAAETARVEREIAALRARTRELEEQRARVDAALDATRGPNAGGA
ncbi:MAG TPA: hypothetical protein VHX66_06695 [Solirubrobacteraceae bacterium]|jgi:chromosome segregation ATPase|nr:hypothetical protein [Solirubrobacteraceae bacterium]